MPADFSEILVVGVSSRALFNLEEANQIFKDKGIKGFREYQLKNEDVLLEEGTAYPLIKNLLKLNDIASKQIVEVIIMSRNSPETGARVLKSIKHLELPITRSVFTGGESLSPILDSFKVDLFLSKDETEVQKISDNAGCATALIYDPPSDYIPETDRVKFAFDADAVVFSEESEQIYKEQDMAAFHKHELENEDVPLKEGPFANLIKKLSKIQEFFPTSVELTPLRIAIVTARNAPSHMRVIKTLRKWSVYADEAYFLGGLSKDKILKALGSHIFFDDQETHLKGSSKVVPSGKVLYKSNSPLKKYQPSSKDSINKNK